MNVPPFPSGWAGDTDSWLETQDGATLQITDFISSFFFVINAYGLIQDCGAI